MTDTQDLKRYKYGYSSDEWGMGRSLGLIPDPAGKVCLFADAHAKLDAAQAEIARLKETCYQHYHTACQRRDERDAALARLAALEKQEPIEIRYRSHYPSGPADGTRRIGDWKHIDYCAKNYGNNPAAVADADAVEHLYAAAGASSVQPSQAGESVVYQSRMRPLWGQSLWAEWSNCTKGMHDDYKKTPILNDWEFEARALSVTPQTAVQQSQAGDAQNAARYRHLRSTTNWASNSNNERIDVRNSPELWDAAIDAAMTAKNAIDAAINAKESK